MFFFIIPVVLHKNCLVLWVSCVPACFVDLGETKAVDWEKTTEVCFELH